MCAIFEKSVKTLLDDFAPMVPQLCEMLGRMYSTVPQASALDLTRQVSCLLWAVGALDVILLEICPQVGVCQMAAMAGVPTCVPGMLLSW